MLKAMAYQPKIQIVGAKRHASSFSPLLNSQLKNKTLLLRNENDKDSLTFLSSSLQ